MNTIELGDRAQSLLKTLIESYIRDGQPVGSRTLSRDSGLDLSPASVRNVMADLEELGLVTSPHTSAGRIPTVKGYRVFVDSLLTVQPLDSAEVQKIQGELGLDNAVPDLLQRASHLLSSITRMAGVVTLPRRDQIALRHIEFISLSERRVLAIFVLNTGEVQNKIIHTARQFNPAELQQAANYLNAHYIGHDVSEARGRLLEEMRAARDGLHQIMHSGVEMAEAVLHVGSDEGDYVLAGQTNLMEFAELSNVTKLRQLFDAFNEKRDILHLLDQCVASDGVQIFIGEESGYHVLGDCSIITSAYEADGRILGVLGVIGPTRMDYERVIPLVDVTAKLLSAALNQR